MTEDDKGRRENRTLMEGHNQLVPLKLPHLVGDGLHLEECVAKKTNKWLQTISKNSCQCLKLLL